MAYDRRTLLKAMAGTSAAGLLAGCGGDGTGNTTEEGGDDPTTLSLGGDTSDLPCDLETYGTIQPDEGSGEVTLWHARTDGGTSLLEDAQSSWQNNTDSSLTLSRIPQSNFQAKLQSSIPSGDGPYLFEWAHDRAGNYDANGFLSDQAGNIDIPNCMLTDVALEASAYDGKRIGVPWAAETVTLMYNKEMVDEPPETLSDMKSIMEEYHDPDNGTYGLGYAINPYNVSGFAQAYGEEVYNGEEDTLGLTSDEVIRGLRVVIDDLAPYMPDDPGGDAQLSVFQEGNAPLYISGPWDVSGLQDAEAVDLGLTTMPSLPDGGQFRPYTGVKLVYFASKMDNGSAAGAARDYAEWFASNETELLRHANEGNFVPVHTKLAGQDQLPAAVKTFAQQVQNGYPMPKNPKMDQVWGPYGDAVTSTFNGNGNLEDNLETAAENIRESWNN